MKVFHAHIGHEAIVGKLGLIFGDHNTLAAGLHQANKLGISIILPLTDAE